MRAVTTRSNTLSTFTDNHKNDANIHTYRIVNYIFRALILNFTSALIHFGIVFVSYQKLCAAVTTTNDSVSKKMFQLKVLLVFALLVCVECLDLGTFYKYLDKTHKSISLECELQKDVFVKSLENRTQWAITSK